MSGGWLRRPGAALLVVALVLAVIVRLIPATAKQPVGDIFLRTAYTPFFAIRHWVDDMATLREENARLQQALAQASFNWQEREEYAREVERLRVLLDRNPEPEQRLRVARIVGWERRGGRNEVVVDIGRNDGLKMFAPAITQDGVVGKVVEVMDHFSRVQLLTDPSCRVAVRDSRSEVLGVVRVGADNELWMAHVAVESDVRPGDSLITSGVGGIFPAGLRVGVVRDVRRVKDSLLLGVQVTPAAQFDRMDYLYFLQSEAPLPPGAPYDVDVEKP